MGPGSAFAQPIPYDTRGQLTWGVASACIHRDQVAWITLERPTQGNAPDQEMAAALRETCQALGQDTGVRVIVVTGTGEHFCLGSAVPSPSERQWRCRLDATPARGGDGGRAGGARHRRHQRPGDRAGAGAGPGL